MRHTQGPSLAHQCAILENHCYIYSPKLLFQANPCSHIHPICFCISNLRPLFHPPALKDQPGLRSRSALNLNPKIQTAAELHQEGRKGRLSQVLSDLPVLPTLFPPNTTSLMILLGAQSKTGYSGMGTRRKLVEYCDIVCQERRRMPMEQTQSVPL